LITNLERNKSKTILFTTNLKEKLNFLEATHNQQSANLNKIFSKILKTVTEVQNELQGQLDNTILLMKTKIQNYLNSIHQSQIEIDRILGDISGNYQNIITEMKVDSFKEVSQLYQEKISEINENIINITNENYEYFIVEENIKQMQNLKTMDLQKFYSIFKKSSFISPTIQINLKIGGIVHGTNDEKNESSTECTSIKKSLLSKTHSMHDDTSRTLFSNPSSIGFKENSLCKSNQSSKQKLISTDEKTQKKAKNNSNINTRMFVNSSPKEQNSKMQTEQNKKNFKTEREPKIKSKSLLYNYFVKKN